MGTNLLEMVDPGNRASPPRSPQEGLRRVRSAGIAAEAKFCRRREGPLQIFGYGGRRVAVESLEVERRALRTVVDVLDGLSGSLRPYFSRTSSSWASCWTVARGSSCGITAQAREAEGDQRQARARRRGRTSPGRMRRNESLAHLLPVHHGDCIWGSGDSNLLPQARIAGCRMRI
jgi:hypothetical protein